MSAEPDVAVRTQAQQFAIQFAARIRRAGNGPLAAKLVNAVRGYINHVGAYAICGFVQYVSRTQRHVDEHIGSAAPCDI